MEATDAHLLFGRSGLHRRTAERRLFDSALIFDYFEAGDSLSLFLDQFPTVSLDTAIHLLEKSREALLESA
jgi:hypothetical protein